MKTAFSFTSLNVHTRPHAMENSPWCCWGKRVLVVQIVLAYQPNWPICGKKQTRKNSEFLQTKSPTKDFKFGYSTTVRREFPSFPERNTEESLPDMNLPPKPLLKTTRKFELTLNPFGAFVHPRWDRAAVDCHPMEHTSDFHHEYIRSHFNISKVNHCKLNTRGTSGVVLYP